MASHNGRLSQEYLQSILQYDQQTGAFTWLQDKGSNAKKGAEAGSLHRGWRYIKIDFKKMAAHRLAWLYVYGVHPRFTIDHINGIRHDNRIANLRDATSLVNGQNVRRAHKRNLAGLLGVSTRLARGDYRSSIFVNGQHILLGYFKDKFVAHQVYLDAKRKLHEGCTI